MESLGDEVEDVEEEWERDLRKFEEEPSLEEKEEREEGKGLLPGEEVVEKCKRPEESYVLVVVACVVLVVLDNRLSRLKEGVLSLETERIDEVERFGGLLCSRRSCDISLFK